MLNNIVEYVVSALVRVREDPDSVVEGNLDTEKVIDPSRQKPNPQLLA